MGITLKIVLLVLGILGFIGCIFWWYNEDGWEPKVATIGALSTVIVLIFNLSQQDSHTGSTIIDKNVNSPVANKIETQNNYYGIQQSSLDDKESNINYSQKTEDFISSLKSGKSVSQYFPKAYSYEFTNEELDEIVDYLKLTGSVSERTSIVMTLLLKLIPDKLATDDKVLYMVARQPKVFKPIINDSPSKPSLEVFLQSAFKNYLNNQNAENAFAMRSLFSITSSIDEPIKFVNKLMTDNPGRSNHYVLRQALYGKEVTMSQESKLGWCAPQANISSVWNLYPFLDEAKFDKRTQDDLLNELRIRAKDRGISPSKLSSGFQSGLGAIEKDFLREILENKFVWNVTVYRISEDDHAGGISSIILSPDEDALALTIWNKSKIGSVLFLKHVNSTMIKVKQDNIKGKPYAYKRYNELNIKPGARKGTRNYEREWLFSSRKYN